MRQLPQFRRRNLILERIKKEKRKIKANKKTNRNVLAVGHAFSLRNSTYSNNTAFP